MKSKLKAVADVTSYVFTIATSLLAVVKFFAPGGQDSNVRFFLYAALSAVPDLICVTVFIWAARFVIGKFHFAAIFRGLSVPMQRWRRWQRLAVGGLLVVSVVAGAILTCLETAGYLRARRRFYVYLFDSGYERLTEREHLFAALTWQFDKAVWSAKELQTTFKERRDHGTLDARMRGYTGLIEYCARLNESANNFRQQRGTDHRLAIDHYSELLSLAPLNVTASGQLEALRAEIVSKEPRLRALYRAAREENDAWMRSLFAELKGYMFENVAAQKIEARFNAMSAKDATSAIESYVLSFNDEDSFVESIRQSWRIDLAHTLRKRSEQFERISILKPPRWGKLGKLLLESDLPAYSRAALNALIGYRDLDKEEKKLRIRAMVASGEKPSALVACNEYLQSYALDDDIRLASATALQSDDRSLTRRNGSAEENSRAGKIVDLLGPFGTVPATHTGEILGLRG